VGLTGGAVNITGISHGSVPPIGKSIVSGRNCGTARGKQTGGGGAHRPLKRAQCAAALLLYHRKRQKTRKWNGFRNEKKQGDSMKKTGDLRGEAEKLRKSKIFSKKACIYSAPLL